ncbi:alpha/beta hydrolase [Labrys neptuniae]
MSDPIKAVPVDPELEAALAATIGGPDASLPPLTAETIVEVRAALNEAWRGVADLAADLPIEVSEHVAPGPDGAPEIALTLLAPKGHAARIAAGTAPVPGIFNIHGGGMIVGHRTMFVAGLADLVIALGVVVATVEYRLAPEHPHPAPVEDCHAGLIWFAGKAAELGIDPARIVVMGSSAGGGLGAGVALMARDRASVPLAGQLLVYPMLDDRNVTVSSRQYLEATVWTRDDNELGWSSLLGAAKGTEAVPAYAAPARANDLSNLPPAYIEVGSAELFRDENVDYASRIWAVGGTAELHVWSGGFHGFDTFAPESELAHAALAGRLSWLRRVLKL